MKNFLIALQILFIISAGCLNSLSAADLSLGLTTWYSMWDQEITTDTGDTNNASPENTFMAGPILALKFFDKWNLGVQFYAGKMTNKVSSVYDTVYEKIDDKYLRYDSDFTLGYKAVPWFTIFAGYKFFGYNVDENRESFLSGALNETRDVDIKKKNHGLAIGAAFSFEVYNGLYFLLNGSFMKIKGDVDIDEDNYDPSGVLKETEKIHADIDGWGVNCTPSFAYYFDSVSTTVSLGFRYQYQKTKMDTGEEYENYKDKFYGVTLSAIYNIPDL